MAKHITITKQALDKLGTLLPPVDGVMRGDGETIDLSDTFLAAALELRSTQER